MVNIQTVMKIINKFRENKLCNGLYFSWNINYHRKNGKTLYKLDITNPSRNTNGYIDANNIPFTALLLRREAPKERREEGCIP